MSDKRLITGTITCARCGESISVTAYPMIAVEKPNGIHYTSHPGADDKIVPSEGELYWYDADCPKCGKNNESVIGHESLIAAAKRLAELDKKIMPGDLNVEYETLTKMLEVLSLFQAGDATQISALLKDLEYAVRMGDMTSYPGDVLERMRKMARLMEAGDAP